MTSLTHTNLQQLDAALPQAASPPRQEDVETQAFGDDFEEASDDALDMTTKEAEERLKQLGIDFDAPHDFHCPITLAVMENPMVAADGMCAPLPRTPAARVRFQRFESHALLAGLTRQWPSPSG